MPKVSIRIEGGADEGPFLAEIQGGLSAL
ncbi:MAG: hypothetical protein JCHSAcid_08220 [uncultured Acidilobus sp. JCHS]|nr:MAG: hypothetical protein JCHSAcid_08220 [uncultured Acidilobus sp. JCHS]